MSLVKAIVGPMMAGKTTKIMMEASNYDVMGYHVVPILPDIEGVQEKSRLMLSFDYLVKLPPNSRVKEYIEFFQNNFIHKTCYVIDELHLFNTHLINAIKIFVRENKRSDFVFLVSGLIRDYLDVEFDTTKEILCCCDSIVYLTAICSCCKNRGATRTRRLSKDGERILVDPSQYIAVCWRCDAN